MGVPCNPKGWVPNGSPLATLTSFRHPVHFLQEGIIISSSHEGWEVPLGAICSQRENSEKRKEKGDRGIETEAVVGSSLRLQCVAQGSKPLTHRDNH